MVETHPFQKRISYKGPIPDLLIGISNDYGFGSYKSHEVVGVGYEDFNLILETDSGKYFLKFFSDFRDERNCQRYIDIILAAVDHGVKHPRIFQSQQGYFHKVFTEDGLLRLIALEYIDGKSFFELKQKPTKEQCNFIVSQAALINTLNIKPKYVYDSWAIVNFLKEYKNIKQHINSKDTSLIEPLANSFSSIDIKTLPHCFVHGDIIDTNVMRTFEGSLYILDFSVSNYYPRVQELSVMLCDILFDPKDKGSFLDVYSHTLETYQKFISLDDNEIDVLPIYLKAAHAMHIIGSTKSALEDGGSEENDFWLNIGREGLEFTSKLFS